MRPRKKTIGGSLDSLLDTMTNVVGILVILLAVTQIGVGQAVERIRGFVEEVSETEVEALATQAAQLKEELDDHREKVENSEQSQTEVAASLEVQRELSDEIVRDIEALSDSRDEVSDARAAVQQQAQKVKQLEEAVAKSQAELQQVRAELAETPVPNRDLEATVVHLPNPRPAPQGFKERVFICRHGRIVPYDPGRLRQIAQEEIGKHAQDLAVAPNRIDCDKLVAMFEETDIGNGYFRLKIKVQNGKPLLVVEVRKDAGDTAENVSERNSIFRLLLVRLDRRGEYLRFHVFPDSFEAYLAARDVADGMNIVAGWRPFPEGYEYRVGLGLADNIFCSGYEPPPPPEKPKTKPKPKPQPKPAPVAPQPKPQDVVD